MYEHLLSSAPADRTATAERLGVHVGSHGRAPQHVVPLTPPQDSAVVGSPPHFRYTVIVAAQGAAAAVCWAWLHVSLSEGQALTHRLEPPCP